MCNAGDLRTGVRINGYLMGPRGDYRGAQLGGVDLSRLNLLGSDFSGAYLSGASFECSLLADCVFDRAICVGTRWPGEEGWMRGCSLVGSNQAQSKWLELGESRDASGLIFPRMSKNDLLLRTTGGPTGSGDGAIMRDLRGVILRGAVLRRAYLPTVNFEGADLRHAQMGRAVLASSCLERIRGRGLYLERADIRDASFRDARLVRANLQGTERRLASFERADLEGVDFDRPASPGSAGDQRGSAG